MPSFNRRRFVTSMVSGAVALSLTPTGFAQYGPIPGKVLLRFNENPYGPSERGLQAAADAARDGAYYPLEITGNLLDAIAERNQLSRDNLVLSSGSNEALHAAMVGEYLMEDLAKIPTEVEFSRDMYFVAIPEAAPVRTCPIRPAPMTASSPSPLVPKSETRKSPLTYDLCPAQPFFGQVAAIKLREPFPAASR